MSRELRICPGVGNRECGAFLSSLDRDPHPTCPRCRGKICTCDLTCDFCVGWSPAQWELFAKKIIRNHALQALFPLRPARELLRKFCSLELAPPLLPALQEGRIRWGGSQGAPGVVSREASSPPARPRSSERGGSVSGHSSVARERASVSAAPSGAGEGEVAWSQRTSPARAASSVASPCSSQHARRRDESREVSVDRSFSLSSRVSRSSDRGTRKDRRARSRSDSSRDRGRRSRSRSSYCSRSRGREHRRRSSSRSQSSCERLRRERSRYSDRSCSRRVRSRSRGDRSRYRSRRDRSRSGWSRSSDHYRSRRQRARSPARQGARGHAISLVVLMTARGLVDDTLPPLTIRGQRREDGEPDVSSRRVWRW